MEERSKEIQESTQADSTGLVATIIVLVLLLLGSTAAYLLMRWHFAKRRGRTSAAGAERGDDQGSEPQNNIFVASGEKVYAPDALDHVGNFSDTRR